MVIAAAVGAVATIGSAVVSSSAAGAASKAATNAANANNALQSNIYNSNKGELQPAIDRGNAAGTLESNFLGLGTDPGAAQTALNTYLGSTGYQFQLGQGVQAIDQSKATSGLLDSGSTLKALDAYGQNVASTYSQNWLGNLQGVSTQGTNAAGNLAGVGQNYANAVSANNNTAAAATGNAALTSANDLTGAIGNALGAYGTYRGLSSYGSGNPGASADPRAGNPANYGI